MSCRTALQRDHFTVEDVDKLQTWAPAEWMRLRQGDCEAVPGVVDHSQALRRSVTNNDPNIHLLVEHRGHRQFTGLLLKVEPDLGIVANEHRQVPRKPLNQDGARCADADIPADTEAMLVEADPQLLAESKHVASIVHHRHARGCGFDPVRTSDDQRCANFLLENADAPACRRKREVQMLRRLAHASHLAGGQKDPQALQVVVKHGFLSLDLRRINCDFMRPYEVPDCSLPGSLRATSAEPRAGGPRYANRDRSSVKKRGAPRGFEREPEPVRCPQGRPWDRSRLSAIAALTRLAVQQRHTRC